MPDFLGVGNSQTFAAIIIAVFLCQFICQANSLSRGFAAFDHQRNQLLAINEPFVRFERRTPAKSGFTDCQLLVIHAGISRIDIAKCGCYFRDSADGNIFVCRHR